MGEIFFAVGRISIESNIVGVLILLNWKGFSCLGYCSVRLLFFVSMKVNS